MQALAAQVRDWVNAGDDAAAQGGFGEIMALGRAYSHEVDSYNFLVFNRKNVPVAKRALLQDGEYSS